MDQGYTKGKNLKSLIKKTAITSFATSVASQVAIASGHDKVAKILRFSGKATNVAMFASHVQRHVDISRAKTKSKYDTKMAKKR